MPSHLLIGPVGPSFADRYLPAGGDCIPFDATASNWEAVATGFPQRWVPDALLVRVGYTSVPGWVWSAPVPVVALASDPNLLWHDYRALLPLADLVLTDRPAVDRFRRAGLTHVSAANLYGLDRSFLAEIDAPETHRDIDVLFVGNLNPAVQRERLPWLGQLTRLADRYRVMITTGVFGADYRTLLRRAKLVFNHSIRGECNQRAFEAPATGAVLLQESDNEEVSRFLEPGTEFVPYTSDTLEDRIAYWLANDTERRAVAERARARVRGYGWLGLVRTALTECMPEWVLVQERAARRIEAGTRLSLTARIWQRASLTGPDADPTLAADLASVADDHGCGLFAPSPAEAERYLVRAAAGNRVSQLGHATILLELGRQAEVACRLIAGLEASGVLTPEELTTCPYPVRFDHLRVGWERAGWNHPDDPAAEAADKLSLMRSWANAILASVTRDLGAYAASVVARPDLPPVRAALGCALARAGKFEEAVKHLRVAIEMNPFDTTAAEALAAALAEAGRPDEAAVVRADRRRLAQVASRPVPDAGQASASPRTKVVSLPPGEFARRFGCPEVPTALCGFTPPGDTRVVLALVAHLRPLRALEVGTAAGHMTANLTAWTPPNAVVFSIGVVSPDGAPAPAGGHSPEVPTLGPVTRWRSSLLTPGRAISEGSPHSTSPSSTAGMTTRQHARTR